MASQTILPTEDPATEVRFKEDAADKLAEGLLAIYQPHVEKVKKQLTELTKKQESLVGQLSEENRKMDNSETAAALLAMQTQIRTYSARLTNVKKDMHQLSEKTTQIKKRALRLQANKQKEALQRENQRELQLQREQQLIAQPSSSSVPSP